MSWSFAFILVPTACYAGAALMYAGKGNWPLAITYSGYCIGNIGLLWFDLLMAK